MHFRPGCAREAHVPSVWHNDPILLSANTLEVIWVPGRADATSKENLEQQIYVYTILDQSVTSF